ncbi:WS/DGAT domain-containing protein [Geodermatophilus sp. TF02-6]|uniref:WS/DGAT domain-containing protein n=1 Tax=Geodermatophilus sp. TF02-6 TaxID=2250575 RepID=UPI0018F54020|nr:WS/DGAT domain-containing protein [Geodermatophilus sp. TF02-6]
MGSGACHLRVGPGVPHPVYIAGSQILRMFPFGPPPGCGAMVTLLWYEGQCCIGVNLDTAAVPDPAGLVTDLQAGLDAVVALGR